MTVYTWCGQPRPPSQACAKRAAVVSTVMIQSASTNGQFQWLSHKQNGDSDEEQSVRGGGAESRMAVSSDLASSCSDPVRQRVQTAPAVDANTYSSSASCCDLSSTYCKDPACKRARSASAADTRATVYRHMSPVIQLPSPVITQADGCGRLQQLPHMLAVF